MLFSIMMEIKKILVLQMGMNIRETGGALNDNLCGNRHSFGCLSKLLTCDWNGAGHSPPGDSLQL